jgi:hypothetical protein
MIEIVFSDSACGSLMERNPADVYGFHLMLSVGDISEDRPGAGRRRVLEHLFSLYPNDGGRRAAREIFNRATQNLEAVRERAAAGEALRIRYSNHPDEMCGFYWFMEQLDRWEVHGRQVSVVKLPEWEADEKGNIRTHICWGELGPEDQQRYIALQKPAPPVFGQSCAFHWRELQKENAPLRAVLNGQLVSAPETLYDDFIRREIAAEGEEFQEVKVVGRVLGNYQLGIGDSWVALRIEEMIRIGELEVVSAAAEDMPVYHRWLRKR